MCSHQVLNMFCKFPMCSPSCSQEHLTLFHMVCPTLSSWNLLLGGWILGIEESYYVSMFWMNTFTWGRLQSLKTSLWWANQRDLLQMTNSKLGRHPQLSSMDHAHLKCSRSIITHKIFFMWNFALLSKKKLEREFLSHDSLFFEKKFIWKVTILSQFSKISLHDWLLEVVRL
jgi:hypothetical protein